MKRMWTYVMGLGCNMWADKWTDPSGHPIQCEDEASRYYPTLSTDRAVWQRVVDELPSFGVNTVVIDLGEGVQYESHPELAVPGAWTKDELRKEIARMRAMGLEVIPKLNFSARNDGWLGEYAYMLSTRKYYEVAKDLVGEVCELFDSPRLFHLGMNNESAPDHHGGMASIRTEELWWRDLYFFFNELEHYGTRPWIFSDYFLTRGEEWEKRMPKSCAQSNFHYERMLSKRPDGRYQQATVQAYVDLARLGYDQIPIASDWCFRQNFAQTVWLFLEEGMCDEHLLGFASAPWAHVSDMTYYTMLNNANRLKYAKAMYNDYHTIGRDALLARIVAPNLS